MKKRALCLFLSLVLAASLTVFPAAAAGGSNQKFMTVPQYEPPEAASGLLDAPSEPLPGTPLNGLLKSPAAPLPALTAADRLPRTDFGLPGEGVEISTAEELMGLSQGSYVLTADIDLSGVAWTPAANKDRGDLSIDGQGHKITGLSGSLLANRVNRLELKNLILTAETVQTGAETRLGAVAGYAKTVVMDNCRFTVALTASAACTGYAGGVVGLVDGAAEVSDCGFDCTVSFVDLTSAGGVFGSVSGAGQFTGCCLRFSLSSTEAQVTRKLNAGGLAGTVSKGLTVTRCTLAGTAELPNLLLRCNAGGLAGSVSGGDILVTDLRAEAEVAAVNGTDAYYHDVYAGCVFGAVDCEQYSLTVSNAGVTGSVSAQAVKTKYAGGLAGSAAVGTGEVSFTDCYVNADISALPVSHRGSYAGGLAGSLTGNSCYMGRNRIAGSFEGYYAGGLAGQAEGSISAASCVTAASINGGAAGGFFGYTEEGELRDCLSASRVYALVGGGIAGETWGVSFVNCAYDGYLDISDVQASDSSGSYSVASSECSLGGIAGIMMNYTSMERCRSAALRLRVTAEQAGGGTVRINAGGLVGKLDATSHNATPQLQPITGCCAQEVSVEVSGTATIYAGGLVGRGSRQITGCRHEGGVYAMAQAGTTSAGGLVGYLNEGTITDCCAEGDVTSISSQPTAGGLVGYTTETSYINCYAEGTIRARGADGSFPEGAAAGGLSSGEGGETAENCRFTGDVYGSTACGLAAQKTVSGCLAEGSVTAEKYGAGVGYFPSLNASLGGGNVIQSTRVEMSIRAGVLGAGFANRAEINACAFAGTVDARAAYGLAEKLSGGTSGCRVEGTIRGRAFAAGLARYRGESLSGCSAAARVSAEFDPGEEEDFQETVAAAGLIIEANDGYWDSLVENCSFTGTVRASCGADTAHELQRHKVNASGLYGDIWSYVRDCRVDGSVLAESSARADVSAGGIGETKGDIGYEVPITGCIVNGSVSAYARCPKIPIINNNGVITGYAVSSAAAGGILGWTAATPKAEACHVISSSRCTGSAYAYAAGDQEASDGPWVGKGRFTLRGAAEIEPEETPETYVFRVVNSSDSSLYPDFPPVEGATVTFGGVESAETDAEGLVSFTLKGYRGRSVWVSAEKEGWWSEDRCFIAAEGREFTIYMHQTEEGKFYVTSCTAVGKNGPRTREILEQKSTLGFTKDSEITISTKVNWCGLTGGALWLRGKQSGGMLRLTPNGSLDTTLNGYFLEGEKIELVGKARNSEGRYVELHWDTCLRVVPEYVPDVPIELEDCADFSGVWVLSKLVPKVVVKDTDHLRFNFEYADGQVFLTIEASSPDLSQVEIFEGALQAWRSFQLRFEGAMSRPLAVDNDSFWKGYLVARLGFRDLEEDSDYDLKSLLHTKNHGWITEAPLQWTIEYPLTLCAAFLELKALPSGFLRADVLKLPINPSSGMETDVDLSAGVSTEFSIFAGLGEDFGEAAELKGGLYGEAEAGFRYSEKDKMSFDLKGYIAGKVVFKVWEWLELEKEARIGSFELDQETGEMVWTNELPEIFEWDAADLSYASQPGGFRGAAAAAAGTAGLRGVGGEGGPEQTVLYENIGEYADAVISGDRVCFTAAAPERPASDALVLYASRRQADGGWTEPVPVADDGSLDSGPSLSGSYLVWSDTDAPLSENSLDAALAASGVSAAVAGEDGYAFTRLTAPGDGYDFGAVVSACEDGAWAAWLHNDGVTAANLLGEHGENTLYAAYYDGTGWTVSQRGSLDAEKLALSGSVLWYRTADGLYTLDLAAEEAEPVLAAGEVKLWSVAGDGAAWLDGEGKLILADGSSVACAGTVSEIAAFADGSVCLSDGAGLWYAVPGAEAPILLAEGYFRGLQASLRDGVPELLCFRSDGVVSETTDLCLLRLPETTDLVLTAWEDRDAETEGGVAVVSYSVYNNSGVSVESVTVEAEENGELLLSCVIPADLKPGGCYEDALQLPTDGSEREITVSVLAGSGEESDNSDNSAAVSVGWADADVTGSRLYTDPTGRTWLEVYAVNGGTLTQETLTVTVTAGGEVLETREFTDVLPGSACSFTLETDPDEVYAVSAETAGDRMEWNDSKLLTWSEPAETSDPVAELVLAYAAGSGGGAEFELQNPTCQTAECRVIAALYDGEGRMKALTGPESLCLEGGETWSGSAGAGLPAGGYTLKIFFLRSPEGGEPLREPIAAAVTLP